MSSTVSQAILQTYAPNPKLYLVFQQTWFAKWFEFFPPTIWFFWQQLFSPISCPWHEHIVQILTLMTFGLMHWCTGPAEENVLRKMSWVCVLVKFVLHQLHENVGPCSWFEYGFLLSGYATPIFSELQNMRTHSSPPKIRICKVVQTALNLPISLFNGNNVLVVALWLSLTTHMLKICTLLFCVPMRSTAALVVKQNQGDTGWTYH